MAVSTRLKVFVSLLSIYSASLGELFISPSARRFAEKGTKKGRARLNAEKFYSVTALSSNKPPTLSNAAMIRAKSLRGRHACISFQPLEELFSRRPLGQRVRRTACGSAYQNPPDRHIMRLRRCRCIAVKHCRLVTKAPTAFGLVGKGRGNRRLNLVRWKPQARHLLPGLFRANQRRVDMPEVATVVCKFDANFSFPPQF
jgi:hypothetical protein